ncbi:hypothetical protein Scep_017082 [Stephania cephalantha]|uniref:Uncharacterized protein n=1 Tax=Stephania cephalantha TaxID=152367 RepID=A0AAP0NUQ4_9MAGN
MAAVDRPEAPMDVDDAEASSADGGLRCSGGPARRPACRGARGRADDQQQLGGGALTAAMVGSSTGEGSAGLRHGGAD